MTWWSISLGNRSLHFNTPSKADTWHYKQLISWPHRMQNKTRLDRLYKDLTWHVWSPSLFVVNFVGTFTLFVFCPNVRRKQKTTVLTDSSKLFDVTIEWEKLRSLRPNVRPDTFSCMESVKPHETFKPLKLRIIFNDYFEIKDPPEAAKKKTQKFTSHAKMHTPKMAFVISNKQSWTVAVKKLTKWQKSKNPRNYKTSGWQSVHPRLTVIHASLIVWVFQTPAISLFSFDLSWNLVDSELIRWDGSRFSDQWKPIHTN